MAERKKKSRWSSFAKAVAPGLRGALEFHSGLTRYYNPYRGPMNGQTARLEIVRQIIVDLGVAAIVETGTFRGVTTEWFAQFGVPVTGIEVSKRFFAFTKRRLRNWENVEIRQGDSVDVLADLVHDADDRTMPILFYLDAHWGETLPLREEIEIIVSSYPKALLVIDDFKTPGDDEYIFDDYGPGKTLDLNLVRSAIGAPLSVFFPVTRARDETGMRRGCAILTADSDLAARLEQFSLLRVWSESTDAGAAP